MSKEYDVIIIGGGITGAGTARDCALRLVEGLQYREIAEELDMELNTVRTRIRRAKAQIDKMKSDNNTEEQ